MKTTVFIKKAPSANINDCIDRILADLERDKYTIVSNPATVRYLSRLFKNQRRENNIYFSYDYNTKKSVITIPPNCHVKRDGRVVKWEF